LSAKDLPGGRTEILNVHKIRQFNRHPVKSEEDSAPEKILYTEYWFNWDGDLDNPNDSEDNCAADIESDIAQDNTIKVPGCPEQQDSSDVPNVPGLIRSTGMSKGQAEKELVTVSAIETRRKKGVNKM